MDPSVEMFASNQAQTLKFFAHALREVVDRRRAPDPRELWYTASILAHFALVSDAESEALPLPGTLRRLFELYVFDPSAHADPELMEGAAAQSLMLTGYFGSGMERRHSIRAYSAWGKRFFEMSAVGPRRDLLIAMAQHYDPWRDTLRELHDHLQAQRFVLRTH
ncbi:MAG: hypothetical protein U0Q12_22715 [Vicinamibacterales bacterium]